MKRTRITSENRFKNLQRSPSQDIEKFGSENLRASSFNNLQTRLDIALGLFQAPFIHLNNLPGSMTVRVKGKK